MPPHSVTTHAVVKFRRMSDEATLPTKATPGAAAYDLYAHRGGHLSEVHPYTIVGTGIEIELPPGHVGLVCSRSGLAANQRLARWGKSRNKACKRSPTCGHRGWPQASMPTRTLTAC